MCVLFDGVSCLCPYVGIVPYMCTCGFYGGVISYNETWSTILFRMCLLLLLFCQLGNFTLISAYKGFQEFWFVLRTWKHAALQVSVFVSRMIISLPWSSVMMIINLPVIVLCASSYQKRFERCWLMLKDLWMLIEVA